MKQKACFTLVVLVSVASLCFGQKITEQLKVQQIRTDSLTFLPGVYKPCDCCSKPGSRLPVINVYPINNGETSDSPIDVDLYADSLKKLLKYPEEAFNADVEAKFEVGFRVDKFGFVDSAWVVKCPHSLFEREVRSAVAALSTFAPARKKGTPVPSVYLYSISFNTAPVFPCYHHCSY